MTLANLESRAHALARTLRELRDAEKAGIAFSTWSDEALAVQRRIRADPEVCNLLSNFVWDWFSEADVRRKEPGIEAEMDAEILRVIKELEAGRWPD